MKDITEFSNINPAEKTLAEIRRDAYIVGFEEGKAEAIDELEQKLRVWDNKVNAIPIYVWNCFNEMKEQKNEGLY